MSVAVIGGGVTGLAAAYRLRSLGFNPVVYEAGPRTGGVAWTKRRGGFLAEAGPNSFSEPRPSVAAALTELGLADRLIEASPVSRKRYIVREGRPQALPQSASQFFTSAALSIPAKLSFLREPFVSRSDPATEESVAEFVRRRFNDEVLTYVAGPFIAGIFAGEPQDLSMRHALPRVYELEQRHGSVLGGLLVQGPARTGGRPGRILSFPNGIGELTDTMAARLGGAVHTGLQVQRIARHGIAWSVATAGDETLHEAIVLAAPAHAFAELVCECDGGARLAALAAIPYAPVAVVVLGFHRGAVAHPLDGFGILVPAVEQRRVLGVLFSSSMFPGRAPEDHVTLTSFVGGTRQPELAMLAPDALVALVRDELTELVGAFGDPAFRQVVAWPRAIPQYLVGYGRWLELLDEVEAANPGLALAGSYRYGVSVGDALSAGLAAGDRLGLYLR